MCHQLACVLKSKVNTMHARLNCACAFFVKCCNEGPFDPGMNRGLISSLLTIALKTERV